MINNFARFEENSTLRDTTQIKKAIRFLKNYGLKLHIDKPKNWDHVISLKKIVSTIPSCEAVLDAGGEYYSPLLTWLRHFGYNKLFMVNKEFAFQTHIPCISCAQADCCSTCFPDRSFGAISCLSVIEHGIDLTAFFSECFRLLKPNGILLISTDYWPKPINTSNKFAYGSPVVVYDQKEISRIIKIAENLGFYLQSPINYFCDRQMVYWSKVDLRFTFIQFTLYKGNNPKYVEARIRRLAYETQRTKL